MNSEQALLQISESVAKLDQIREQIAKVIVGQTEVTELVLTALLCEGHVLLEGVPGLGKTKLVRTLAQTLALQFGRIQFTPDLIPADVLGVSMVSQNKQGDFDLRFEPGPIFANLVLADEINRASPKTQAALLEAMQEQTVTIRGERHPMPRPFLVLATQNPLEMEGTYPLPEAQIDRFFFKILVQHPSEAELESIIERTVGIGAGEQLTALLGTNELQALQRAVREVVVPPHIVNYAARLVMATQPQQESASARIKQFVRYGAGPRGAQALVLAAKAWALMNGRYHVTVADLKRLAGPALRHRIAINFEAQIEGIQVDQLLNEIIQSLPPDKARAGALG